MNRAIDLATPRIVSLLQWLHTRLFSTWSSSLASLGILYLAWMLIPPLIDWAFVRAVWSPENASLCRDAISRSACWAFVADKYRFILFGTFPFDQQWRPALTIAILIGLYTLSALRSAAIPHRFPLAHRHGGHRRAHVGRPVWTQLRRE